jgi:hypothetical protein
LTRLAIITNFQAGRNRTRPELIRELSRKAGGECREVGGLDSIRTVIREIMDERVDILGINGGDGTVHGALTELMRLGCELPELAVIPGGTTNMTANDFNDNAPLEVTLHRLAEEASTSREDRRIVTRPMLRASADGLEHDTSLRTAGDSVIDKQVLVLATTLERMLLGLKPWWGRGSGPIHVTGLRRKPREVLRRAPAFLRGRSHPGLTVENGYYSENVAGFEVRPDSGFALDGEIFDPGPGAPVDVSATDPIRFLRLDGR